MHRPGTDSHGDAAADPPIESSSVARCSYSFRQFNRAVPTDHTDQDGQNYDAIIIMTDNDFLRNHALLLRFLILRKFVLRLLSRIAHVDLAQPQKSQGRRPVRPGTPPHGPLGSIVYCYNRTWRGSRLPKLKFF